MVHVVEMELAGRQLRLETGRVARQASGAVWASYADTVVLATAVGLFYLLLTGAHADHHYLALFLSAIVTFYFGSRS